MPASHAAGQPGPAPMRTVISHAIVPLLMGLIMTVAYLGGFHKPSPHHVPVAVVGQQQQVAPLVTQLEKAFGDKADIRTYPTPQAASGAIEHLDVDAAYVPGRTSAQLLTASAASDSTATIVKKMFEPVAQQQGVPLTVKDVVAVDPEHDPAGQNAFFYLVTLSVASYATSIGVAAAGATRKFRDRTLLALGAAVLISVAELAIAVWGFGMFGGHVLATFGLSLLYSAAVLMIGVGLHPIVGRFSTLVYSAIFVAFNFTSSGGVFSPTMQPALFRWLHHFWIGAGFVETLRRVMYFPHVGVGGPLGIVIGWFVLGLVCLGIGATYEKRRDAGAMSSGNPDRRDDDRLDDDTEEEIEEAVAV